MSLFEIDQDLVSCMIEDLKRLRIGLSQSGETEVQSMHKIFPTYIKMCFYNEKYWIGITFDRAQTYYTVLCEGKDGRVTEKTVNNLDDLEQFTIDFLSNKLFNSESEDVSSP